MKPTLKRAFLFGNCASRCRLAIAGLMLAALSGCSSPAHNEFIELVQKGKNAEIGPGLRLSEMYSASYKINEQESETVPFTAVVTITPKSTGATWKLKYEYRDHQWRFQRDESRKFAAHETDGAELTDEDIIWKKFATKDV